MAGPASRGETAMDGEVGGPGFDASPSVLEGGGAHWPKRHKIIKLVTVSRMGNNFGTSPFGMGTAVC